MSAPARASRAKSPKSPAGFQVTIGNTGALIRCAADETVLHAAMQGPRASPMQRSHVGRPVGQGQSSQRAA